MTTNRGKCEEGFLEEQKWLLSFPMKDIACFIHAQIHPEMICQKPEQIVIASIFISFLVSIDRISVYFNFNISVLETHASSGINMGLFGKDEFSSV